MSVVTKPLVLVVDDSKDDVLLMEKAAKKIALPVQWRSMHDGNEAVSYILGKGKYSDRILHPLPTLMFLDLKMPSASGFSVLSQLHAAKISKPPYICVLTSMHLGPEIQKVTDLGADVFHAKPFEFLDLCDFLERLVTFFCLKQDSK